MSIPFSFHPTLVIRTPRYPFNADHTENDFDGLLRDTGFLESLFLASPVLYYECIKYTKGEIKEGKEIQKLRQSVLKYYSRSFSRCTPFGLFSGCGTAGWTEENTAITLAAQPKRHTRLDMNYLCALAQFLETLAGIKEHLLYFPNSSIYNIGDEIRYIEYKYFGGRRIHQISSVSGTDYLELLLGKSQQGMTIRQLADLLAAPDIEDEEAGQFIDELLQAQLFVSELEPAITGDEFAQQILAVLKKVYGNTQNDGLLEIIGILETVTRKLAEIDAYTENDVIGTYQEIMNLLRKLGVAFDESKLFQVDMSREVVSGGISKTVQDQLLAALTLLNRFGGGNTNANLQGFARKFYERYEDREMPLLEVLDTETGIGYLDTHAETHSPLTEDIVLPVQRKSTHNITWSSLEKYLVEKITDAYRNDRTHIELKEEEMTYLKNDNWGDLPPSLSIMFRVIDPEKNLLFLESGAGSSAANLLGRFAHADEKIRQAVEEITAAEQQQNKDIIFAEIVHLPESRVGNVLLHPAFREYEIPYLAKSSLAHDKQIRLQDIMISVKQESVTLRCKRTGKVIIPRLSNAHNYQYNALPVYQFLCDLQNQYLRPGLYFHWGTMKMQFKVLPRVMYGNTILWPATWQLLYADLADLRDAKPNELPARLEKFIAQWKLPRYVVLAEGDNELLIDFENMESVRIWLDAVRKKPGSELKEFLRPLNAAFSNEDHQSYNNQVVASFVKDRPTYAINGGTKKPQENPSKRFVLGDEWVYYKFYCGVKSADKLLLDVVAPVMRKLQEEGKIAKFFFIRYNDPSFHIRLRLQLTDPSHYGDVIRLMHEYAQPFLRSGYIWKIQTDTYNREYDRYGVDTMEMAESIFHYDSEAVLDMLEKTWGDEREKVRWLWTMRNVDELLTDFNYTPERKRKLLEMLKDAFAKEFNADKFLKTQLNNKYRFHKKEIETLLDKKHDEESSLAPILDSLHARSARSQRTVADILNYAEQQQEASILDNFLSSYIHMLINRSIPAKQRLHEMVIYDFLYRHYHSVLAREGAIHQSTKVTVI